MTTFNLALVEDQPFPAIFRPDRVLPTLLKECFCKPQSYANVPFEQATFIVCEYFSDIITRSQSNVVATVKGLVPVFQNIQKLVTAHEKDFLNPRPDVAPQSITFQMKGYGFVLN